MKRKIVAGIIGVMVLLLSACSAEKREEIVVVEEMTSADTSPEKSESEVTPADTSPDKSESKTKVPESPTDEENASSSYRDVYKQLVSENDGEGIVFSLIYLNNDEIPELVVCDRGYGTYSIYTVKDGSAFCLLDAMTCVELFYLEKKGVLVQFARWNGGGDEGGYGCDYYQVSTDKTLADGELSILRFTYDAVYDEEGNYAGEGVTRYYHLDQEIEKSEYQKQMNDMGIIEGSERLCDENALLKKEMLDYLVKRKEAETAQIAEQSFETEFYGFGKVIFAPFWPERYSSENPDYGETMFGDVRFMLLSSADEKKVYQFPGETEDNILTGFIQFNQIIAVAFRDYNGDGREDVLLILEYLNSEGEPFRKARVYSQEEGEKEFSIKKNLSDFLWDYTESMERLCEGITFYQENISLYYPEDDLSDEELTEFLKERGKYYRESAYYQEITDYWENVREVRDVSNHMIPLYKSSTRYLTKEELASEPPVVIHLAKNEIYARHGYIFKDADLYNYFMGCTWYTPTIAPEDFSEELLNEYEKENLKLLAELDT